MTTARITATRWYNYARRVMDEHGLTAQATAFRTGISSTNISNWKNGHQPAAGAVIRFARGMDEDVLVALVEAEFITEKEARL